VPYSALFARSFVQTINWDTWSEAGMALEADLPLQIDALRRDALANGLTNEQGVRVFAASLASGFPRVVVSKSDTCARAAQGRAVAASAVFACGFETALPQRKPPIGPAPDLERRLCRIWSDALRLESVGPDDNVFERGADSLLALEVIDTIGRQLAVELSPIACFEAPTPRLLARLITAADSR
jgi:phthiocerol/phenolphthiocerol synthesis type-I polyketide synthase E